MNEIKVGFALCGSFCTFAKVFPEMERLVKLGFTVFPIFSEATYSTDTRFGKAADFIALAEKITGHEVWHTISQTEPVGPRKLLDALVVAPCTGNTLGKLAASITDSCVTMAAKSHLRNGRPLILAVSSNDALSGGAKNIGILQARRQLYFVPYGQDDPMGKPTSLVADMTRIPETLEAALEGVQYQPMVIQY